MSRVVAMIGKASAVALGLAGIMVASSATVLGQKDLKREVSVLFAQAGEITTAAATAAGGAGGAVIATRAFTVNKGYNTAYITIVAAADEHTTSTLQLGCLLNGIAPCTTSAFIAAPNGWVAVQNLEPAGTIFAGDWHDNSVVASFCVAGLTNGSTHTVQAKFGTGTAGQSVFLEKGLFTIDIGSTGCS